LTIGIDGHWPEVPVRLHEIALCPFRYPFQDTNRDHRRAHEQARYDRQLFDGAGLTLPRRSHAAHADQLVIVEGTQHATADQQAVKHSAEEPSQGVLATTRIHAPRSNIVRVVPHATTQNPGCLDGFSSLQLSDEHHCLRRLTHGRRAATARDGTTNPRCLGFPWIERGRSTNTWKVVVVQKDDAALGKQAPEVKEIEENGLAR